MYFGRRDPNTDQPADSDQAREEDGARERDVEQDKRQLVVAFVDVVNGPPGHGPRQRPLRFFPPPGAGVRKAYDRQQHRQRLRFVMEPTAVGPMIHMSHEEQHRQELGDEHFRFARAGRKPEGARKEQNTEQLEADEKFLAVPVKKPQSTQRE